MAELDKQKAVDLLNRILEAELAGVVRYTHYSFLVFGHNRIPIVTWMREQAAESLTHAQQAGEMITVLGEYPSLGIGPLLDNYKNRHRCGDARITGDRSKGASALSRATQMRGRALGNA